MRLSATVGPGIGHTDRGGLVRVVGDVIDVDVHEDNTPINGWEIGTRVLLGILLLPLLVAALMLALILSFFRMGFFGGLILGMVLPGRNQSGTRVVRIRTYVVRSDRGDIDEVRQIDELNAGRILRGHRIDIAGVPRHGAVLLKRGTNLTTGAALLPQPNLWKVAFFAVLGLLVVAAVLL